MPNAVNINEVWLELLDFPDDSLSTCHGTRQTATTVTGNDRYG